MSKRERIYRELEKVNWDNDFVAAWRKSWDIITDIDADDGRDFFDSMEEMIFDADIAFEYAYDDEQCEGYDGIKSDDIDRDKIYCYGWGDGLTECTEEQARLYRVWMLEWFGSEVA